MSSAMLLLFAFLISIARETREYPPNAAGTLKHYLDYLHTRYGGFGFSARCMVLALSEGLFLLQIVAQSSI